LPLHLLRLLQDLHDVGHRDAWALVKWRKSYSALASQPQADTDVPASRCFCLWTTLEESVQKLEIERVDRCPEYGILLS
jgi:hypothetical protein